MSEPVEEHPDPEIQSALVLLEQMIAARRDKATRDALSRLAANDAALRRMVRWNGRPIEDIYLPGDGPPEPTGRFIERDTLFAYYVRIDFEREADSDR